MSAGSRPAVERIADLLPVHVRARDESAGGLLTALTAAVAAELGVLEADIDELYSSWFIETCPEWVVPYIADLLGVVDLPPDVGPVAGVSRRAFVANTIAYRQRKGTAAVVEQVARDASGWPARVVEFYRILATTTHIRHVRLDRPATATVRTPATAAGPLEHVPPSATQGALDSVAHTADVRRIASGRGRYGIDNIGVFLFPDQVYETGWARARPPGGDAGTAWSVHPLGHPTPLYAVPTPQGAIERLAEEPELPVPLRPRRLLSLLVAAREAAAVAGPEARQDLIDSLPIGVRVEGEDIDPERLRVCGHEDLSADPDWQVMVDAVAGRLHTYRNGVADDPSGVEVRYCYGGSADVGAGPYDRSGVHADVLAADPYRGDPLSGGPGVTAQAAVLADDPDGSATPTVAQALADAQAAWAAGDGPAGATYVVSIGDDATYEGDLVVHVPPATRLVLVAASWQARVLGPAELVPPVPGEYGPVGIRPHIGGSIHVTGGGGSSVVLDGLVIEGDIVVGPGDLASLAISQCTVAGSVEVGRLGAPANIGSQIRLVRSICGPIHFGPAAASLEVVDSIVDAAAGSGPLAITGEAVALQVAASTVRGGLAIRTLDGTSSIFDGRAVVEHRQTGCVRYSYIEPGSRVPRRYRCTPEPAAGIDEVRRVRPVYAATDAGSPHYLALARTSPAEIATGGEGDSEMGVHHHLQRPVRLNATARLVAPYVPAGLAIGVAAPVATGRS